MTPSRVLFILGACIGLSLCQQVAQPEEQAWLRFAHAWPVEQQFDVFIGDLPNPIWNRVGFSHITSYVPIEPGMVNVSLREWFPQSTLVPLEQRPAISLGSLNLEAGQYYSLAVFNSPQAEETAAPTEETVQPTPEATKETVQPTPEATEETVQPTPEATEETVQPTPEATEETVQPTPEATEETAQPTEEETVQPTPEATEEGTAQPTEEETAQPTEEGTVPQEMTGGEMMLNQVAQPASAMEQQRGWKLFMDQNMLEQEQMILFRFLHLSEDFPALSLVLRPSQQQANLTNGAQPMEVQLPLTTFLNNTIYTQVEPGVYDIVFMSGEEQQTGTEQETTGTEQQQTGTEQEMTGMNQTGTEEEMTGTEQQMTGTEQQMTGTEQQMTGTEQQQTGTEQQQTGTEQQTEMPPGQQQMEVLSIEGVELVPGNIYSFFAIGRAMPEMTGTEQQMTGTEQQMTGTQQQMTGTGQQMTGTEQMTGTAQQTGMPEQPVMQPEMMDLGIQGVLKFDNWALIPGQQLQFPAGETAMTSEPAGTATAATQ